MQREHSFAAEQQDGRHLWTLLIKKKRKRWVAIQKADRKGKILFYRINPSKVCKSFLPLPNALPLTRCFTLYIHTYLLARTSAGQKSMHRVGGSSAQVDLAENLDSNSGEAPKLTHGGGGGRGGTGSTRVTSEALLSATPASEQWEEGPCDFNFHSPLWTCLPFLGRSGNVPWPLQHTGDEMSMNSGVRQPQLKPWVCHSLPGSPQGTDERLCPTSSGTQEGS